MKLKRRFGINLFWTLAGNWSREIINFGVFLALARVLGPRSYGIMGMISIFTALANALLVDGLSIFIVREENVEPEHVDAVFWLQALIAGLMSLGMVTLAPMAARIYGEPMIAQIMPVMSILPLLFCVYSIPSALLQRAMQFRPLTVRALLASLVGGSVGVGLAVMGYGVWSLVLMSIAQWSISCVCLWGVSEWRPRAQVKRHHFAAVVRFGANALSVKLLAFANQQLPRFVIGTTLGAVALGYFTMAWRIIEVMSILTVMPIGQVMLPTLGSLQSEPLRLKAGLSSIIELSAAISLPCYLGLFAIAPVILPALYGPRWEGAIYLLQLFSIFGIAWAMLFSLDAAMVVKGRMASRTRFVLLGLMGMVAGLFVTRNDGLIAIGTVIVGLEFLYCGLCAHALSRIGCLDWAEIMRRVGPFAAASLIMVLVVSGFRMAMMPNIDGLALTAAMVAVGALTYLTSVAVLAWGRASLMLQAGLALREQRSIPR